MMIICLTVRCVCYSLTWSCIIGNAEGEGVRGPVSETGNQFLEGWTPSCSKSKFRNGPQRRTPGPGPVLSLKGSCIWTTWRWRLLGFFPQDKKYATDKYKDIYTELSIVRAKADRDVGRLRDQLQLAQEALGEPTLEEMERGGYGVFEFVWSLVFFFQLNVWAQTHVPSVVS